MARRASALAFPWISAIDSEKLAKSTVNHSQMAICRLKPSKAPYRRLTTKTTEMKTDPIQTMNMTGFLISLRGSSLRKAIPTARLRMGKLQRRISWRMLCSFDFFDCLEHHALEHQEMLQDGPEGQRGEEVQPRENDDRNDEQDHEGRRVRGKGADARRDGRLGAQAPGDGEHRYDDDESADQHRDGERHVVEDRVDCQARESAPVVPDSRRIRVQDLRQSVRALVVQSGEPGLRDDRRGGEEEDRHRLPDDRQDGKLHLA